ncbi:hypothetical protein EV714DRAFT_269442 [Schizophyllum commune]
MTFFRTVRLVVDDAEYDFPLPEVGMSEYEIPRPGKDGKIARPPNQWIVWRSAFMKACVSYGKMLPGGLCTHAHRIWDGLPQAEKLPWALEAKRIADEHKRLYPDYKFHPIHDPAKRKARAQQKKAAVQRSTSPEDESEMYTPTPDGASSQRSRMPSPAQYTPSSGSHVTYGPGSLSSASIYAGGPAIRLPSPQGAHGQQRRGVKQEADPSTARAMPSLTLSPRWYDAQGEINLPPLRLDPSDHRGASNNLPSMHSFLTSSTANNHRSSADADENMAPVAKVRRTAITFEDSRRTATNNWPATAALKWPAQRQAHDTPAVVPAPFPSCGKKRGRCSSGTVLINYRNLRRASLCDK